MAENNVYAVYNFNYNFSSGSAYLSTNGFVNSMGDDTFIWTCRAPTQKASVTVYYRKISDDDLLQLECLDEEGGVIPGTEEKVSTKPAYKSQYTFTTPLNEGDKIVFRVSSNLSGVKNVLVCNASITVAPTDQE